MFFLSQLVSPGRRRARVIPFLVLFSFVFVGRCRVYVFVSVFPLITLDIVDLKPLPHRFPSATATAAEPQNIQWGLLITFIELIKNPRYSFWSHSFTHCAPELERVFESVARSCMTPGATAGTGVDDAVAAGQAQ